ncbi:MULTISPECIES: hypothetical protein [Flavobacteriaceae]|uniref:hypothetical protein n=1 Tax=Flavobacteriaceae TaxID=49546 RepID=UPI003A8FEBEB
MGNLTLNDHLDEQLERLRNEDLKPEELELEIKRTKAICAVADKKIENQRSLVDMVTKLVDKDELENYLPQFGINKPQLKQ